MKAAAVTVLEILTAGLFITGAFMVHRGFGLVAVAAVVGLIAVALERS